MQLFVAEMAMFAQQMIPLFVTERKETRNIEDMYHLSACIHATCNARLIYLLWQHEKEQMTLTLFAFLRNE